MGLVEFADEIDTHQIWQDLYPVLVEHNLLDKNQISQNIMRRNIDPIHLNDIEPALRNSKHWEILDSIHNPSNVTLLYNSNLSSVKDIEKYWPKFKNVNVNASMDAVGELGEYLRYGTNWDRWEENLNF